MSPRERAEVLVYATLIARKYGAQSQRDRGERKREREREEEEEERESMRCRGIDY